MEKKRIKANPALVVASLGILGIAYCPTAVKPKPPREFITQVYARPTGHERWRASIQRQQEILKEMRAIRKQIRTQADILIVERQRIIDPTPKEQGIINRSNQLINKIFNHDKEARR